jgi:hypothetical protein
LVAKPTHNVPTPTAQDHIERKSTSSEVLNPETNKSVSLDRWVKFWPASANEWRTPNASDAKKWSSQSLAERKEKGQQIRLTTQVSPQGGAGGQLNPDWVEWLMGFPIGWTALKNWVTPSSRKSRK